MRPDPRGRLTHPESPGDLAERHPLELVQLDELPLRRRQLAQRLLHATHDVVLALTFDMLRLRIGGVCDLAEVADVGRHEAAACALQGGECNVAGNRRVPRHHGPLGVWRWCDESPTREVGAHHGDLQEVVDRGVGSGQAGDDAAQPRRESTVELVERISVVIGVAPHQGHEALGASCHSELRTARVCHDNGSTGAIAGHIQRDCVRVHDTRLPVQFVRSAGLGRRTRGYQLLAAGQVTGAPATGRPSGSATAGDRPWEPPARSPRRHPPHPDAPPWLSYSGRRLLALAAAAFVAMAPLDLRWRGPADCPNAAHATASIERLLAGHEPPQDRHVRADVELSRGAYAFVGTVRIDDGTSSGERALEGATCEQVADAASLIIAMAIDPRLGIEGDPPTDVDTTPVPQPPDAATISDDAAPGSAPAPVQVRPTTAAARPGPTSADGDRRRDPSRTPRPLRTLLRASAGAGFGSVPTASAIAALALAIGGPRWRAEIDVDGWLPRTRRPPGNNAIGVRVAGWSIGVHGCGSPLARRLEIPLCAGVRIGALHGRGVGDLAARNATSVWIAASAGLGLWGWINHRFALAFDVEGLAAITKPAFVTRPSGFTVRSPPGGVRGLFGLVVRWP